MFLFHSSSFSTSLTFTLFSNDSPQQSLRTGTHCNLLLKHKHNRVPQAFFEDCLHLHRINYKRFSGAASKSCFYRLQTIICSLPPPLQLIRIVNIQQLPLCYLQVDTQSMEENRCFDWRYLHR